MERIIKITVGNQAGYHEKYDLLVETTNSLSSDDYKTITDAMKSIATVLDPRIARKVNVDEKDQSDIGTEVDDVPEA